MPSLFSRKSRTTSSTITPRSPQINNERAQVQAPASPPKALPQRTVQKREDAWTQKEVLPEDVQELLHLCTQELKSKALNIPFFLLPFRPNSTQHLSTTRAFIRRYFKDFKGVETRQGDSLLQEIRLLEPFVLSGIVRWCWSRLIGGVITWKTYELFKSGEQQSNMDKHAFDTFLPLSTSSNAHRLIVLDFFELLAAIAAHSKTNGLGGRTLSRFAGWWALEHTGGKGFEPGYKSWASAADATSHMFFAYLRARAPTPGPGSDSISQLPRSLQTLVRETEYPPTSRTSAQSTVASVVMVVDSVSPTPFTMLQRARDLEYRHHDNVLRQFAEQQDPVKALTPECRRVLDMIAASSQSNNTAPVAPSDSTWADFESTGFSALSNGNDNTMTHSRTTSTNTPNRRVSSRPNGQSWADFMNGGFSDEDAITTPPLSFPAKEYIPLINPDHGISPNRKKEEELEPAELASVERATMDETFWWVWMESLAPEEPLQRKASFGRCVFVELDLNGSHWVAFEEQVRPAMQQAPSYLPEALLAAPEKKRGFLSKKTRTASGRQVSSSNMHRTDSSQQSPPLTTLNDDPHDTGYSSAQSTPAIGTDKQALIQAAAAQLVQKVQAEELTESVAQRRGRRDLDSDAKTVSVLSMQPVFVKDAAPALQWARKFDKEIRSGRTQDDQASISSNVRSVSAPMGPLPPAYASKENVAIAGGAQSVLDTPARTEASSTAGAEETPRKEAMVPSPLNIPKRKPVGGDRQPDDAGRSSMNVVSPHITEQEPEIVQQEPAVRPNLMKSKTGSRRGLRDLFKRKVTDPMAKSSSQRAVSGNSTFAGQQEQKPGMLRKSSLLGKKFGPAPPPALTGPSSQNRDFRSPSPVQEQVAEERPTTPGQRQVLPEHGASNFDAGEPGPTMTSSSGVFGAAPGTNVMDTIPDIQPASPTFSNFTSATDPDAVRERSETTSTRQGNTHTRNETVQSMPSYALDFDPGSPQRVQDVGAATQEGPSGFPSFKTRAAALLNPQSESSQSQFPARGSSMPFEASTTSFGSGQTRSDLQTPHDSSGTPSQEFHDVNTAAHSYAPTAPTSSAAPEVQDDEDDYDSDGAPRPNTQERLNTASSRWAQIRQNAHARTASQAAAAKDGQPSTPPWQQQDLKDSGLGSIGTGSGFSPGVFGSEPRTAGAPSGNQGLGIQGIQGPGQSYASESRQNAAGAGEPEESIEDRVARIKARVAALTQSVST